MPDELVGLSVLEKTNDAANNKVLEILTRENRLLARKSSSSKHCWRSKTLLFSCMDQWFVSDKNDLREDCIKR